MTLRHPGVTVAVGLEHAGQVRGPAQGHRMPRPQPLSDSVLLGHPHSQPRRAVTAHSPGPLVQHPAPQRPSEGPTGTALSQHVFSGPSTTLTSASPLSCLPSTVCTNVTARSHECRTSHCCGGAEPLPRVSAPSSQPAAWPRGQSSSRKASQTGCRRLLPSAPKRHCCFVKMCAEAFLPPLKCSSLC